jgi:hypothetical protein
MCVKIRYLYPNCGCAFRIGHYTCFHAKQIAKSGFNLGCERYKETEQVMRTGEMACKEHLALLERQKQKQRVRIQERTSEEVTDRSGEGEGESLMDVDGPGGECQGGEERHGDEEHMDGDFDGRSDAGDEVEDGAVLVGHAV